MFSSIVYKEQQIFQKNTFAFPLHKYINVMLGIYNP